MEDYIPGDFIKWCSNYGYISPKSALMPAFMHWSWVHSKPSIGDVVTNTSVAMLQLNFLETSTAYSHELKFPREIRKTMTIVSHE